MIDVPLLVYVCIFISFVHIYFLKLNILLINGHNCFKLMYLKFKANDLKGPKLWGKSTNSVKAALTYFQMFRSS